MQLILRTIFTGLLALASLAAAAQQTRTLLTSEGKKYFEGRMLIKNRNAAVFPNSYLSGDGFRERDLADNWKGSITPFLPENLFNQVLPDGRCTLFYKNEKVYVTQEYDRGVANGRYEERYADGDRMISGRYTSGMMDGDWKYFFKNGKTAFEGSFYALPQQELFEKLTPKYRNSGNESSFSEERFEFAHTIIAAFRTYDRHLLKLGTGLNGRYNFYYYDGQKNVSIGYKKGLPDGLWQSWDRNGKLLYQAEFESGKALIILQDGKPLTYEAYQQKYDVPQIVNYGDPNGVDPGPVQAAPGAPPEAPSIFRYVEQMPQPGVNLPAWINEHLEYPAEARKNSLQGRVIVQFVVREDGSLSDFKVERGIGSGCDQAAVDMLKKMPAWIPGKQNGQAVDVYFTLPVTFKL